MNTRSLMIQGTGSSVGKSLLAAALCRILCQDGYQAAPFKSQNMALNSFITPEGDEMGRAQVVQAEACGLQPSALMNPILLKPTTDKKAQVILKGKVHGNMSAAEYHNFKPQLKELVLDTYRQLAEKHDIIVIEGAGSPAEINLRENDLVNMGLAEMVDAPVLLVGDIDKGGVFASLYGTILLLGEEERKRVKGVIINKFRGDLEILRPGIKMLEDLIKIPVLGVIPYMTINIEDEDSVSEEFHRPSPGGGEIKIEVLRLPHIANFTDFKVLRNFPDVSLRYVNSGETVGDPDILILPGSKNTIGDLQYLRETGLDREIYRLEEKGRLIIGICGGYQMLGRELHDPYLTESGLEYLDGLGLLDMSTIFEKEKITTQVKASVLDGRGPIYAGLSSLELEGYEIHMGISRHGPGVKPLIEITRRQDQTERSLDGVINGRGNVWGTYIHGIFDNTAFTRAFLNNVRIGKGLLPLERTPLSFREFKEQEYQKLASVVRSSLDMDRIYALFNKNNQNSEEI